LLARGLRGAGLSIDVRVVETREGFMSQLREFQPDLILSDYSLPAFNGLEALQLVRRSSKDLPFILVSGQIGEEKAAEAFRIGATDILLKDRLAQLGACVNRALREVEERAERVHLEAMFQQAQKMEAVGQLTGGLAHDFNNILAIIDGYLELLQDEVSDNPTALKWSKKARGASGRAADLIRRLLAFSRRQPLDARSFDMREAASSTVELLRRTVGEDIEFNLRLPGGLWPVFADPDLFAAALTNLVVNARDAMPDGGQIAIEARNQTVGPERKEATADLAPGDFVVLEVSDAGTGIPAELLNRIFEPFFTTKEVGKGSGLGLSMVYGFAKQSGGDITVESGQGAGTTFRFYLPRGDAPKPLRLVADRDEIKAAPAETSILLVEDNAELRDVTGILLAALGYHVIEAKDARQGLRVLARNPNIDILFTDVVMPGGMNGLELAAEARTFRPDLKVLFTSGHSETSFQAGSDARERLLAKPYLAEELARRLRELIDTPGA